MRKKKHFRTKKFIRLFVKLLLSVKASMLLLQYYFKKKIDAPYFCFMDINCVAIFD